VSLRYTGVFIFIGLALWFDDKRSSSHDSILAGKYIFGIAIGIPIVIGIISFIALQREYLTHYHYED